MGGKSPEGSAIRQQDGEVVKTETPRRARLTPGLVCSVTKCRSSSSTPNRRTLRDVVRTESDDLLVVLERLLQITHLKMHGTHMCGVRQTKHRGRYP